MILVLAILVWVGGLAFVLFGFIKHTLGLRINDTIEEVGGIALKVKHFHQ